ncbi:sulfocyanin-like copper-binding protein [Nonomuraea sp. NPDC000554]|uniref:sulfocyanin-like copper-binding protein n=1 Tax=Nonomuraea sp. NPDC000554 TaxID=3154259 RepID=UPI0033172929
MRLHKVRLAGTVGAALLIAVAVGHPTAAGATPATGAQLRQECTAPPLAGHVVDVTVGDSVSPGSPQSGQMWLKVAPAKVPAGTVSLRVANKGTLAHEVIVLPLPAGQAVGKRATSGERVSEAGSLGEASHNCAAGGGGGIAPHSMSWATLKLPAGHYELVCNFPGHYASGMRAELDVTGP